MAIVLPKGVQYEIPQGYKLVGKEKIGALETATKIDSNGYALMQEGDKATSAISMTQGFNGKRYLDTHKEVLRNGLVVPTPAKFMPHLRNVNEALNERTALYDASGNLIEGNRLSQYGQRLNRNCWVWLNAGFEKGSSGLEMVTITGLDAEGKPIRSNAPLETCLMEDGWADLESLNKQGLPTQKSPIGDKYEPGKTAYFWYPRSGAVSRFNAISVWAYFICDGDPAVHDDGLGVFSSAEGAKVAKNQGTGTGGALA